MTTASHDWALLGDRIAGHVLVVDDATLAQALAEGGVWEGTVEVALAQPWINTESRQPYQDAFLGVLAATQHVVETARSRQLASDLEERLSGNVVEGNGVRPFGKGKGRL